MRIRLDENMPMALARSLRGLGHDVDTVPQEGLGGSDDRAVWQAAQGESRFLITQDLDFSDIGRYRPGAHAGLLLVRLREPGRRTLALRVQSAFESNEVENWRGCFVVLTDRKVRVRRPQ